MLGYKVANNNGKRVIITLEIPEDALTNLGRSNLVNKSKAKYRTNKAKVLSIQDEDGTMYDSAESGFYDTKLTYLLNEIIEEPNFNKDVEKVSTDGIHFFLAKRVAEMFGLTKVENGCFESWYQGGQKSLEVNYINGKMDGIYRSWHENGQKARENTYKNGDVDGLYQEWYSNREKCVEVMYVDGKIEGLYRLWYSNGQKECEVDYVNGKMEGFYVRWHQNGQKSDEVHCVGGNFEGIYRSWDSEGEKLKDKYY